MGILKKRLTLILLSIFSIFLIGCGNKEKVEEVKEDPTLKIGLMPAVDTAPILVAEKNGYFKDAGINIEMEIYNNDQNRQSALQAIQ